MRYRYFAISILLALLLFLSYCKESDRSVEISPYLNHQDSVKYVGMQVCASCHADKYSTFIHTGMGRSLGYASLQRSSADFRNLKPVYDAYRNMYYMPVVIDSNIYIKEYRLEGIDTIYSRTEKISYIVGSGHHTNSHLIEENGYVFQAPLTFYTQEGKWDLPPGFEAGNNSGFDRRIGLECMSCHNGLPEIDNQSDNRYLNIPLGIDCERCHGPGEIHVREKKAGKVVDISREIDYTIVNPAKLSWNRQIDLCQRCHLQGNAVLKPGKSFTDFKPGMRLSDIFDQFSPDFKGGDEFVMAAHAERFQMSKCFKSNVKGDLNSEKAKVGFTCISCHDPHLSVKQTNKVKFNNKCASCHNGTGKVVCNADPSSIKKMNNDCVQCHMPSSGTSDIPHVSVHDHYIRKPGKPSGKGTLIGLRCITQPNPDKATLTEAYISYYEKFDKNSLYLKKAIELSSSLNTGDQYQMSILIHLYYINLQYKEIVNLVDKIGKHYDAWTAYRIAKAYQHLNRVEDASLWYENALELQSANLDFLLQYASHLLKIKNFKKAEIKLNQLLKLYDKSQDAWAGMGLVYMSKSQYAKARECFDKALKLYPDQLTALQNLRILENLAGNSAEVAKLDARIKKISR